MHNPINYPTAPMRIRTYMYFLLPSDSRLSTRFCRVSSCVVESSFHTGSGSYDHFCPRPCSSTYRKAKLSTHRHTGTTLCAQSVLSCLTLAVQPPDVCPCQRDWAVSIRSHMQQDMDTFQAPPPLGAPFSLFENHSRQKPRFKQLTITLRDTWLSSVGVATHGLHPARRKQSLIEAGKDYTIFTSGDHFPTCWRRHGRPRYVMQRVFNDPLGAKSLLLRPVKIALFTSANELAM